VHRFRFKVSRPGTVVPARAKKAAVEGHRDGHAHLDPLLRDHSELLLLRAHTHGLLAGWLLAALSISARGAAALKGASCDDGRDEGQGQL
jgi:hypothetical protein